MAKKKLQDRLVKCEKCKNPDRSICRMCINRHPVIKKLYDANQEIEQCGANVHLTIAQKHLAEVEIMVDGILFGENKK